MIVDFTLSNYGPFRDRVTLSFEAAKDRHLESSYVREFKFSNQKTLRLLRAAIIYGPNAAGKSSLLEALSLLDRLVTRGQEETSTPIEVNGFAFQPEAHAQASTLILRFLRGEDLFRYHLEVTADAIQFEKLECLNTPPSGTAYTPLFERKQGLTRDTIIIEPGPLLSLNVAQIDKLHAELQPNTSVLYTLNKKMTVDNPRVKAAFLFFNKQLMGEVTPNRSLRHWVKNEIEKYPTLTTYIKQHLVNAGIPIQDIKIEANPPDEQELKILNSILPNDDTKKIVLTQLEHRKNIFTEYLVENKIYPLNLDKQESLGTKRYFEMAGLLSVLCDEVSKDDIGRVLPLDEMEHSLHPELIKHFWIYFLKHNSHSQIITTTHHRELLQDRTLFRDDVIWFVDKNHETMSSQLYALEDVKAEAGMRSTSSVYNYYTQGRLGATPQL